MNTTTLELSARLEELRDEYTYRVNYVLDEGREDLATELADDYVVEATRALAETGTHQH